MIQRIQSVWLLLAALAAFVSLKLSFFSGNFVSPEKVKSFTYLTGSSNPLILVMTLITGSIALVAIFVFKNRKLQLRLTMLAFLVSILTIILYYLQSRNFAAAEGSYNITAVVVLLVPVFLILAARGILRDQKLVKSLDRLR